MSILGNVGRVAAAGLIVIGTLALGGLAGEKKAKGAAEAGKAADRHHEPFGKMPAPIADTIKRENSPQDMLQVDLTHSQGSGGTFVSYVRVMWGDLDKKIKGGGKEYYSDWDGQLTINGGTGQVVHQIAFDDHSGRAVTRSPETAAVAKRGKADKLAKADKAGKADKTPSVEKRKAEKARHLVVGAKSAAHGPGPGSGRDKLTDSSGSTISWQAGVVGAYDGLLIKITSPTAEVSASLTAGKFTVPLKITAGS